MDDISARFYIDWPGFCLDVDLTLSGKGVTALFGHSGSGKTTILRCVAGLERAPVGRLVVKGETWQDDQHWLPPHQRPIGYVFQEASLFPHLSVLANLRYGMKRVAPQARGNLQASLDQAVELLGIGKLLDRKPDCLSGGERSRVGMARALAVNPSILLMDEPLAALDHDRKQEILPYLARLHDQLEMPILYVSHAPDEVARLADHIVVLKGGKAVAVGPLGETLARLDLPIRLGEDAGVIIDAVVGERDETWHLARVDFAGGSLWLRDNDIPVGQRARMRILARDVSIACEKVDSTSIQNILPARIVEISEDAHPSQALIRLDVGKEPMIARLTQRAVTQLELAPGRDVWVQIKAVALIG